MIPRLYDAARQSPGADQTEDLHRLKAPRVTVVIPNWNGMRHLPECLEALAEQEFTDHEIVVVDNASSDESVAWVAKHHPRARIVERPDNGGFSKAVNAGIAASHSEYIALLNNDTAVAPDWLGALVQALEQHLEYDFAASRMILHHRPDRLNAAGDVYALHRLAGKNRGLGQPVQRYARHERVLGACAGAALYRRSLFATVGLFDEGFFMTAEDTDFNLRCLIAGRRCLYVPTAQVRHKLRATIESAESGDLALVAARNEAFVAARDLPAVLLPLLPALWTCRMLRQTLLVGPSRLQLLPSALRQMPGRASVELLGMRAGLARRPEVWNLRAMGTWKILRWLIKGSGKA
jgi:GT2 family glycosyltransferase